MYISHIIVNFEKLEEVLCLKGLANIVASRDGETGRHLVLRLISEQQPKNINIGSNDPLSKIGEAYQPVEVAEVNMTRVPESQ